MAIKKYKLVVRNTVIAIAGGNGHEEPRVGAECPGCVHCETQARWLSQGHAGAG